ncbi:rod-determining factor RdfA [Haladaptatus sp. NG-SE-30]
MGDDGRGQRTSKVGRLIEEYDLTGLGETLESYWTGESEERYSLRQLAEFFNQELLRAVLNREDVSTLEGEVQNTYHLLTDDDISSGVRIETRSSLTRQGVDVDRLERDFVSHQAIHTYLTKYRDASHESNASERTSQLEKGSETIRRLQNRTAAVTETTLENLRNTDRIDLGEFDVFVETRVVCRSCNQSYSVESLLESGGCDCRTNSD